MTDYSQNGEQGLVLDYFAGRVGRFLDIGANDGCLWSNTLALVERGWSGVLVEPSPWIFAELVARHGANRRLTLVHAAVGFEYGMTEFWDSGARDGLSTTVRRHRDARAHQAAFGQPFWVAVVPIRELVKLAPAWDFLSIDTEGTSADLFLHFPFDVVGPRIVCVEHDGRQAECRAFAGARGYREIAQNQENLLFARSDRNDA